MKWWERLGSVPAILLAPVSVIFILLVVYAISLISISEGYSALGTTVYFFGWLLVGHGIDVLDFTFIDAILRFNVFLLIFVIYLSFILWWVLKLVLGFLRYEIDAYQSALLWLMCFLGVFLAAIVLGFLLMFVGVALLGGTSMIPLDIPGLYSTENVLEAYETAWWETILDVVFGVPMLLWSVVIFWREADAWDALGGNG